VFSLGYILPITHFAYKNYQAKMQRHDRPFQIEKTFPVILEKLDTNSNLANKKLYVSDQRERKERQQHPRRIAHESDLTGKGSFINIQV